MGWVSLLLFWTLSCSDPDRGPEESLRPEPPSEPATGATEGPAMPEIPIAPPSPMGGDPTSATETEDQDEDVPTDIEAAPVPVPAPSPWLGRWEAATRDGVCIELRANGRFELTSRDQRRGDVVVTGRFTLAPDPTGAAGAVEVTLRPRNVHQERYVTACRRHVFPEQDLPRFRILGLDFRRGGEFVLSLRHRTDGTPELCAGSRCQPLRRRT